MRSKTRLTQRAKTRRQALHAVRQPPRPRRLDQEVRVVVLHRVVRHTEPGAVPARAQRLPEGAHEAPPAQRRHVVEHAQRDQHRAAPGNGPAAAVRHPRAALARPSGAGPGAASARGFELEAGLPGLAAASGLLGPALACVPRTTFPLHGRHRGGPAFGRQATPNYCICQQYFGHCREIDPSPSTRTSPFSSRPSRQRPTGERPGRAYAAWHYCAELEKGHVLFAAGPQPPSVRRSVHAWRHQLRRAFSGHRRTTTTTPAGLSTLCPTRRSCAT